MDAGSFLTRRSYESELIDAMNVRGLTEMDCAAATVGPFDLFKGAEYLKNLITGAGLTVVSANVYDESTGEYFVQPYVIAERAGVKFGITGLLDPEADIRTHRDVEWLGVTIAEARASLEAVLPELAEQSDFVVLLSQLEIDATKLLVEEVPGIDFVLMGGSSVHAAKSYEVGTTAFLQPGYKGQRISDYRLSFDETGLYLGYSGETLALDDKVPTDAAMALLVKEHKVAIEDANKRRATARREERKTQQAEQYTEKCLGVDGTCKRCHQAQYDQWLTTRHAEAFATLERSHQSANPECLRCHSTCYFDIPLDGSVTVMADLRNVQCEVCHGMASDHARDGSYGKVAVASCVTCHDKENSPDFDFAEYLPKVTH